MLHIVKSCFYVKNLYFAVNTKPYGLKANGIECSESIFEFFVSIAMSVAYFNTDLKDPVLLVKKVFFTCCGRQVFSMLSLMAVFILWGYLRELSSHREFYFV